MTDWRASAKIAYEQSTQSLRDIAKAAGVSHTAVLKVAKREQWKRMATTVVTVTETHGNRGSRAWQRRGGNPPAPGTAPGGNW